MKQLRLFAVFPDRLRIKRPSPDEIIRIYRFSGAMGIRKPPAAAPMDEERKGFVGAAVIVRRRTMEPLVPIAPGHNQRDNRLLAALPTEILSAIERDLRQVVLAQGTTIFEPGDPVDHVYFPQTGMISLLVVTGNGVILETATVGREGAVGLQRGLGERRSFTRATAQISGSFSVISGTRFEQVVSGSAAVRDLIARYTEVLWAEAQQTTACNAVHDASSRLCRWLLQSSDRMESDMLPLTQEFLSHMVGVRRTTLTLLAQALQNKGAIRYSRGKIRIVDRGLLEAWACECYHVVRQDLLPPRIGITL